MLASVVNKGICISLKSPRGGHIKHGGRLAGLFEILFRAPNSWKQLKYEATVLRHYVDRQIQVYLEASRPASQARV